MKYISTIKEEIKSLHKNKTWTLVEPFKVKKIIGCKSLFKKKDDNADIQYKVKLLAKGYNQVEGIYFNEAFSLMVNHPSI